LAANSGENERMTASTPQKAASPMFQVRSAVAGDMPAIIGFIDEAATWLADKGTDQWATPWPDEAQRDDRVRRGIDDGCTWMLQDDGRTVGTISCRAEGNPKLWTAAERDEPALYVSRLIVCREYGGQGLGHELFDWAGKWASGQYGARWIRIDVWTTNFLLHDYYEKRGFQFVRKCDYVDYPSAMLFQKATAGITDADLPRLHDRPTLQRPASWVRQRPSLVTSPRRQWLRRQLAGLASLHAVIGVSACLARLALLRDRRAVAGHAARGGSGRSSGSSGSSSG
jgi:GNAT superfamily N-acetyltransferase